MKQSISYFDDKLTMERPLSDSSWVPAALLCAQCLVTQRIVMEEKASVLVTLFKQNRKMQIDHKHNMRLTVEEACSEEHSQELGVMEGPQQYLTLLKNLGENYPVFRTFGFHTFQMTRMEVFGQKLYLNKSEIYQLFSTPTKKYTCCYGQCSLSCEGNFKKGNLR
ncbi:hypothetical protein STEG23_024457 [Scotinomys teguina]